MKKILVTGCNGQLGRAINKEYAADDVEFINTDVVEGEGVTPLDITDVEAVVSLVEDVYKRQNVYSLKMMSIIIM